MKKIVVVLTASGAQGAFEAGAWQAIRKYGLMIDGTHHTDVQPIAVFGGGCGAINGSLIADGKTKQLSNLWNNLASRPVVTKTGIKNLDRKTTLELEAYREYPLSEIMAQQQLGFVFDQNTQTKRFIWQKDFNPFNWVLQCASKSTELENTHFLILSSAHNPQLVDFLLEIKHVVATHNRIERFSGEPQSTGFNFQIIEPTKVLSSPNNYNRSNVMDSYLNGYLCVKALTGGIHKK